MLSELFDSNCSLCELHNLPDHVCVPGRGSDKPKVLFVCEAPNRKEDQYNKALVGVCDNDPKDKQQRSAGKRLNALLKATGLSVEDCYFTHLAKCFPKQGKSWRSPKEAETRICSSTYLVNEILTLDPDYIVPMGNGPLNYFTGYSTISRCHGKIYETKFPPPDWYELMKNSGVTDLPEQKTYKVIPTYHPSSTLYAGGQSRERDLLLDLAYIQELIRGVSSTPYDNYKIVMNPEELGPIFDKLLLMYEHGKIKYLAVDLETGGPATDTNPKSMRGLDPYDKDNLLLCFSMSYMPGQAIVIPFEHPQSPWCNDNVVLDFIRSRTGKLLSIIPNFGQNYKFDINWMFRKNFFHYQTDIIPNVCGDTMLKSWILFNDTMSHDLESMTTKFTDMISHKHEIHEAQHLAGTTSLTHLPLDLVCRYCGSDTDATYRLDETFNHMLEEEGLTGVNDQLMTKAILPTSQMERNGHALDVPGMKVVEAAYYKDLNKITKKFVDWGYAKQIEEALILEQTTITFKNTRSQKRPKSYEEIHARIRKKLEGSFSLSSNALVGTIVKDILQIPIKDIAGKDSLTAKKAVATGKAILTMYRRHYAEKIEERSLECEDAKDPGIVWMNHVIECLDLIMKFKTDNKVRSSYATPMPNHLHKDGLLHSNYGIRTTATGRYNCNSPALQTLPWKSHIKQTLVSRWPNGVLLQGDYGQLEMRVLAMFAKDPRLIEVFNKGTDIHKEIAGAVLGKAPEDVTDVERRMNKMVGFGLVYGRGPHSIAEQENVSLGHAKQVIKDFFDTFHVVKAWIDSNQVAVQKEKCIYTLHNYRRLILDDWYDEGEMNRRATNSKVQGTASDINLEAMIRMYWILQKSRLKSLQVTTVHDSTSYDIYPGELLVLARSLLKQMRDVPARIYPWAKDVPLIVDLEVGSSWGGMCDLEILANGNLLIKGTKENFIALYEKFSNWPSIVTPIMVSIEEFTKSENDKKIPMIKAEFDFPVAA